MRKGLKHRPFLAEVRAQIPETAITAGWVNRLIRRLAYKFGLPFHLASNYNSPQLVLVVAREEWVAVWARIPGYSQCQQIGLQIVLNGGYP